MGVGLGCVLFSLAFFKVPNYPHAPREVSHNGLESQEWGEEVGLIMAMSRGGFASAWEQFHQQGYGYGRGQSPSRFSKRRSDSDQKISAALD